MKLTIEQEMRLSRARGSLAAVSQLAGSDDETVTLTIRRDDLSCLLDLIHSELEAATETAS